MTATVFSTVKSFCTQQTHAPVKGLALVLSASQHMIEHKDWDALAYFLGHAPTAYRGIARKIVGEVLGGVTYDSSSKVAKAHRCKGTFKMGDNFGPTDRMAELTAFVNAGLGLTSKEVKEAFAPREDKEFDDEAAAAYAKRIVKKLASEGYNLTAFEKLMHDAASPEVNF